MQYKFKDEVREEGSLPTPSREKIIEKTGHVITFSLAEMETDLTKFEKAIKELKGNLELKKGILDNMDVHHPTIKDIPEFDRYAIHMYQENSVLVKAYKEKLAEIEKQFEEYKAEIEEVKAQLPELAEAPSEHLAEVVPVTNENNVEENTEVNSPEAI